MIISKHEKRVSWEVSPLPDNVLRYLPITWLRTRTPISIGSTIHYVGVVIIARTTVSLPTSW